MRVITLPHHAQDAREHAPAAAQPIQAKPCPHAALCFLAVFHVVRLHTGQILGGAADRGSQEWPHRLQLRVETVTRMSRAYAYVCEPVKRYFQAGVIMLKCWLLGRQPKGNGKGFQEGLTNLKRFRYTLFVGWH